MAIRADDAGRAKVERWAPDRERRPATACPAGARVLPAAGRRHGGVSRGRRSLLSSRGCPSVPPGRHGVARALGLTVEELFGTDDSVVPVAARQVAPLGDTGARVTLALVGDGHVALPLRGETVSRAGFLPAGGLVAETGKDRGRPTRTIRPISRRGRPWSRRAVIRRCRCWRHRWGCFHPHRVHLVAVPEPGSARVGRRGTRARRRDTPARAGHRVQHRPGRRAAAPRR